MEDRDIDTEGRITLRNGNEGIMGLFALTIFSGAFLLFQVQPLIGKFILPWFGGSPAVWTTCMLFFQLLLLGGYAYAHLSSRLFSLRVQALIHLGLLGLAVASLPITPSAEWKPVSVENPSWQILKLLLVCLGLPYFVLSATGPLMQDWFRRLNPGVSPYRLYALSNVGSLLALVSYPFALEPAFSRKAQAEIWSWGLGFFAVVCGWCAVRLWRGSALGVPALAGREADRLKPELQTDESPYSATFSTKLLWFLLPACASLLLLAFTNKICQDVAVIPFLWVLPLGLYLLSFIICFDSPGLYSRKAFSVAFLVLLIPLCDLLFEGVHFPLVLQVGFYAATLFCCCMICHGELFRLKPHPRYLTSYYLLIAAGGAAGGVAVAILAPRLFDSYAELHWGLWGCALLIVILYARDKVMIRWGRDMQPLWPVLLAGALLLAMVFRIQVFYSARGAVVSTRNFYAALRVLEYGRNDPFFHRRVLRSGQILHGLQFQSPAKSGLHTSYYHELSGVGLALENISRPGGRRIGVVGLGVGTLAGFAKQGDLMRFYEINPAVKTIAENEFTYLAHSTGRVEVVMGDARLSMEREAPQQFDLLVLDAFTSDAIPVHLLTREAFEIYLRHLQPGGVLAIHISNRHLNLQAVTEKLAAHFQLSALPVPFQPREVTTEIMASRWILITRDKQILEQEIFRRVGGPLTEHLDRVPLWTDDHTSLFKILL